jgi:CHAT domain-containing protein
MVVERLEGRLLEEVDATSQALHTLAGQCDVLHVAAHATFRPLEPLFSALYLHDGPFSTLDIFDLDLHCSLAVLSACETALGVDGAGDELMGLSRAFLYAGAPSLLLTLWKVDDRSTSALMRVFYQALTRGVGRAAALREAQMELLQGAYSAPFYWAPFQILGASGPL